MNVVRERKDYLPQDMRVIIKCGPLQQITAFVICLIDLSFTGFNDLFEPGQIAVVNDGAHLHVLGHLWHWLICFALVTRGRHGRVIRGHLWRWLLCFALVNRCTVG